MENGACNDVHLDTGTRIFERGRYKETEIFPCSFWVQISVLYFEIESHLSWNWWMTFRHCDFCLQLSLIQESSEHSRETSEHFWENSEHFCVSSAHFHESSRHLFTFDFFYSTTIHRYDVEVNGKMVCELHYVFFVCELWKAKCRLWIYYSQPA